MFPRLWWFPVVVPVGVPGVGPPVVVCGLFPGFPVWSRKRVGRVVVYKKRGSGSKWSKKGCWKKGLVRAPQKGWLLKGNPCSPRLLVWGWWKKGVG